MGANAGIEVHGEQAEHDGDVLQLVRPVRVGEVVDGVMRLNAAGRMASPDIAARLLLAADETMAAEAQELARQLEKTVTALAMLGADIVGLMELENNSNESISSIVDALNARIGSGDYAYIDTGTIHDDATKAKIDEFLTTDPSDPFTLIREGTDLMVTAASGSEPGSACVT